MKKLHIFILATAMILICTLTTRAQEWTGEQNEVWETSNQFFASWQAGDFDQFATLVHDQYQGWSTHDSLPLGKDALIERFKKGAEKYSLEVVKREPLRIAVTKDGAVIDYLFIYNMIPKGGEKAESVVLTGKNVEFYVRDDGKWQLLGDMTDYQKKESDR